MSLVVCQPDRPAGRGLGLATSPVKQLALARGLPILQPEKIKNNLELRTRLEAIQPEAIVVVAYGRIIPPWMIDLPRLGNINLHGSLLPKYRGAAPVQWAIAMGESATGVTTMRIDAGLDTGDLLLASSLPIAAEDNAGTLAPRLAALGAPLMVETLRRLEGGTLCPQPQDSSEATYAPILQKEDGRVDFRRPAQEIWNRWRGFTPWPGSFTSFRGKVLNLCSLRPVLPASEPLAPGHLQACGDRLIVGCGDNTILEVSELQLEGKKRMSARDFMNGHRPQPGEVLG